MGGPLVEEAFLEAYTGVSAMMSQLEGFQYNYRWGALNTTTAAGGPSIQLPLEGLEYSEYNYHDARV